MRPATKVIVASTAAILGADLVLVYTGNESISSVVGEHPVVLTVVMAYLWFHFTGKPRFLADRYRRFDPLERLVSWFERRGRS